MANHLSRFTCNKKTNLRRVLKNFTPPLIAQTKLSIKCGKTKNRSNFIFLKQTENSYKIVGSCRTNHLIHLIDDFDFLKEQMNTSKLAFELSDARIKLDDKKLIEDKQKGFFSRYSILADLFGMIGFIPAASIYLLFGEFNLVTLIPFIVGLIFWVGSIIVGCWSHPRYVLIEKD
ncbi:MAG: hypothetical protein NWF10_01365 [Candidatus Bathyarchaeota archaeon]|nr:hypothetical protein [Candidatus Bathyarchaeota archaeon]